MLGWLKTLLVSGFVIGLVVYSGVTMAQQNSNTRATMEVEGALMTALLGDSRGQGIDSGISRDEFITAVVGSIVETQKNHGKTVKVSYIFIDKDEHETSVDEDIRSIQFKIEIMNKKNPTETDSVSEKRLAIDALGNREGTVGNGMQTKLIVFEPGIESRSKTEAVGNTANIESVTVNNGSVTHTVIGDNIKVNVTGGTKNKTLTGGTLTPAHTKYVQLEPVAKYNKGGYVGNLDRYPVNGGVLPKDTIYVDKQPTPTYNKNDYKGTLERYVESGVYIPAETKYVTAQMSTSYNSGGFVGTLGSYVYKEASTSVVRVTRNADTIHDNRDGDIFEWKSIGGSTGTYAFIGRYPGTEVQWNTCSYVNRHPDGWSGQGCKVIENQYTVIPREYRYQGNVTKPGVDTRKYAYRGEVVREGKDTQGYAYRGNVTKPQTDTRTYNDGYSYTVTVKYRN